MDGSIFMDWFGGCPLSTLISVGEESFEVISLVFYGRWLLLIGIFLLAAGYCTEGKERLEGLARYRFGMLLSWWRIRFWQGLLSGIRTAVCLVLVFLACDLAAGRAPFLLAHAGEAARIGALWLVHVISLDALFLLLDLGPGKRFVPAAVLLLEGVTFYVGYKISAVTNIMYGTWGMYLRSGWYDARGFSAETVLAAELILIAAGYWAGRAWLRRARDVKA